MFFCLKGKLGIFARLSDMGLKILIFGDSHIKKETYLLKADRIP